jgi:hypothetical protein
VMSNRSDRSRVEVGIWIRGKAGRRERSAILTTAIDSKSI